MSFNQCSGCEAMVATSKAYCPDCGMAMDEEQGRDKVSEFESLMKTQNLNATAHLKILEQFNLSTVFRIPKEDAAEPKAVESEAKAIKFDKQPETHLKQKQPANVVSVPAKADDSAIKSPPVVDNSPNSKKTLYIILGVVLILFGAALILVIILGFIYWNYYK